MATSALTNNGPCHFFRLSAELRNQIYREVLVEKEQISIDTRGRPGMSTNVFAQPGLLRTCRQIRSEASGIYYRENHFVLEVVDLDASDLITFCRKAKECGQHTYSLEVNVRSGIEMIWSNMMEWLQAYHAGLAPSCDCRQSVWDPMLGQAECLPLAMFYFVDELDPDREMEWSKVERMLHVTRYLVDIWRTYTLDRVWV